MSSALQYDSAMLVISELHLSFLVSLLIARGAGFGAVREN
jgi:hypothetical protein